MKRIFNVCDYGAVAGSDALQTNSLQQAIDACFLAGGGEVVVPSGVYRTGGLRIRSHVTLHLLEDAILEGSRDPEDYTHFAEDKLEPIDQPQDEAYPDPLDRRWFNSLLRAFNAKDIAIIGEKGSRIDGKNCYDEMGEEKFRGPHAIGMYNCTNVQFKGYTIKDSANWAHQLTRCKNIYASHVTVLAGHDGIHCRSCENIVIEDCTLHTGDDSIAGFNNLNMVVLRCELNSSCSAFRLGGTDVLIDSCRIIGPGIYGHRWQMPLERKRAGEDTNETDRHNTLTGFLYFCYGKFALKKAPGNIVVQNCDFINVDCLFNLEFGAHIWCCNRSLGDITFRNCRVDGVCQPMRLYSDADEPLHLRMEDVSISLREGKPNTALAVGHDVAKIELQNVTTQGYEGDAAIVLKANKCSADTTEVVLRDCEGVAVARE